MKSKNKMVVLSKSNIVTSISKKAQKRNHSEIGDLIDVTGRRSIFQIRNALYPPKKRVKKLLPGAKSLLPHQDCNCHSVFDDEETIKILESQVNKIEESVNNLITTHNKETTASSSSSSSFSVLGSKLSILNTNELLNLTENLSDNSSSTRFVNEQSIQNWPTAARNISRRIYSNNASINEF
ncbi:14206_t:CDS:1, partial [Ambispora leptoticha]